MKFTLPFLLFFLFFCGKAEAQTRFLDDTFFTDVAIDTGILYGNNDTYLNVNQDLYLDFYEPVGDVLTERPLIIWVHGGGYTSGSRNDSIMQLWCNEFARRGYITASIDYRIGISNSTTGKIQAIYRSVQDAKAAIRFFRKNAATYRVDVNKIIIAGSSVGAFTAIHTAYWDTDELPTTIDTLLLDNLEGMSGNLGYASNPNAVINFWGAIKDSTWIDADEPPIVSCAGIEDSVVYPEIHTYMSGTEYGSIVIDRVAKSLNIKDTLRMFVGAKHTLAGGSGAQQHLRFDTATVFAADFLYCTLIENCGLSSLSEAERNENVKVFPNPCDDELILESDSPIADEIYIFDALGLKIRQIIPDFPTQKLVIDVSNLPGGVYFIESGTVKKRFIKA